MLVWDFDSLQKGGMSVLSLLIPSCKDDTNGDVAVGFVTKGGGTIVVLHLISSYKVDTNVELRLGSQLFSSQKFGAIHTCLSDAWSNFFRCCSMPVVFGHTPRQTP